MRYTWTKAIVDNTTMNIVIHLKDETGATGDTLELNAFEADALAGRLNVLNATRMRMKANPKKVKTDLKKDNIWSRMKRGKD